MGGLGEFRPFTLNPEITQYEYEKRRLPNFKIYSPQIGNRHISGKISSHQPRTILRPEDLPMNEGS